ncbi:unnamed protein product [Clavelina lepadiformis]|uniref:Uncharacterized protein n=1 Tax=Clavelina lepadiformis TaxID=159417 RepID=A0ABP0GYX6_CLALP
MLTWTGRKFSPLSIIEDSPITFGFLYTPRELVYKYVFEGFLVSNNIWKDNIWSMRVKRRSGEKEYLPPRHFRSWYIFPRLKNIIKERRERLDLDLERHHASALSTAQTLNILLDTLCGFSPEYAKSQDSQTGNVLKEIIEPSGTVINSKAFTLGDKTLDALELWTAEYQESDAILMDSKSLQISNLFVQESDVN